MLYRMRAYMYTVCPLVVFMHDAEMLTARRKYGAGCRPVSGSLRFEAMEPIFAQTSTEAPVEDVSDEGHMEKLALTIHSTGQKQLGRSRQQETTPQLQSDRRYTPYRRPPAQHLQMARIEA